MVVLTRFYVVAFWKKCVNLKNKIVLVCFKWFWIVSCRFRLLQGVSFVLGCVTLFCCFRFLLFLQIVSACCGLFRSFFWLLWIVLGCLDCLWLFRLFWAAVGCVGCFGLFGVASACSFSVQCCFRVFLNCLGCWVVSVCVRLCLVE